VVTTAPSPAHEAQDEAGASGQPPEYTTRIGFSLMVAAGRMHPRPLVAALLGGIVFGITLVLATAVLGALTDDLIVPAFNEGVSRSEVFAGAGLFLAVTTLRSLSAVGRRWFGAMLTRRVARTKRLRIADRYLGVPLSFFKTNPTGELLAHADSDIEASTQIINTVPMSVGTIALVFVAAVQIAFVDPVLLLIAFAVFPALAVANRLYTARVHEPAALVQQHLGDVSALAHESFDGALVIKALGREAAETERMRTRAEVLRQSRLKVGRLRAVFEPGIEVIPNLGIIAVLLVGSWRISSGAMTTGDLVAVTALFSVLAFPVRVFGFLLEELPRAVVADARIQNVYQVPDGPPEPQRPVSLGSRALGLSFENVTYAFSDGPENRRTIAADNVSFSVEPGEVVALVGPTGGGKSTLVDLALRLADIESGTVRLGGVDVRDVAVDELRRATALVFQESFLFADTVGANISLAEDELIDSERLAKATATARADGFIAELPEGMATILGERGVTLSGGQRQRVALSRALYREPRLVILDDATSAVDPVIEAEILDGLRADNSTTMLIVAHRLSTIELADRVVYVVDGRIRAIGEHNDLLAQSDYASLVNAYGDQ